MSERASTGSPQTCSGDMYSGVPQAAPWAVGLRPANTPIYAADHLAEQRAFTSVLSLTYRVLK